MKRPEEQIQRAVVSHLKARSMPGIVKYGKGNRWLKETVTERFDRFTIPDPNSGCLLWLGSNDRNGYGQMRVEGKLRFASHISLEIAGNPVPVGMNALHRCDNPACVNSEHLFIGTQRDNVDDMHKKERGNLSGLAIGRGHNRLSDRLRADAKSLFMNGLSGSQIARHLNISKTTACALTRGWRALP